MSRSNRFLVHFAAAFFLICFFLLGFVTWMDPFRNLNYPWATSFVSDRNIAYKKFKLLEGKDRFSDLIVGSSTSEAFVPRVLKEKFGVAAFTASTGGASLPLRYLLIRQALETQPDLKRIIYIADLFELDKPQLETLVYYQSEMMALMKTDVEKRIMSMAKPDWRLRFNDYFSSLVIDRSVRTLKDLGEVKRNTYTSAYHPDGSTTQSMVGGRSGDTLNNRALASALGMKSIYGKMEGLDTSAQFIFEQIVALVERYPNVELHLIIAPFHEVFFKAFQKHFEKTHLYADWVGFLKSFENKRVVLHDFSYPSYFKSGITLEDQFWQDGVHFTSEAMLKMTSEILGGVRKP